MKVLTIIGTRPEAVKMAPVLLALRQRPGIVSPICATGQHGPLFGRALLFFGLAADYDLKLMAEGQTINTLLARAIAGIDAVLTAQSPDLVMVQGDTISALAGALAAANRGIRVAHVEAGLRTYDPAHPWPEENNRRTIDVAADLLFAPTRGAAANLRQERAPGQIFVTGNSGVDALEAILQRLASDAALRLRADAELPVTATDRPIILLTAHRRESLNGGLADICDAAATLAASGLAAVVMPVHPNPMVKNVARATLAGRRHVHLLPPFSLPAMIRMMQRADLILTDSGGIQEEAPTLGKSVLILREATERPEAVEAGIAQLVGTDRERIVAEAKLALAQVSVPAHREILPNPFGDGRAAQRIVAGLLGEQVEPFGEASASEGPVPIRRAG